MAPTRTGRRHSHAREIISYRCRKAHAITRRMCNASFNSASGLDRHNNKHHGATSTTFVFCNPGANGTKRRRSVYTRRENMHPQFSTALSSNFGPASANWVPSNPITFAANNIVSPADFDFCRDGRFSRASTESSLGNDNLGVYGDEDLPAAGTPTRSLRTEQCLALGDRRKALPFYDCRTSKDYPDQLKGLDWRT